MVKSVDGFNIFYTETSPVNYISPVGVTPFPDQGPNQTPIEEMPLSWQ